MRLNRFHTYIQVVSKNVYTLEIIYLFQWVKPEKKHELAAVEMCVHFGGIHTHTYIYFSFPV